MPLRIAAPAHTPAVIAAMMVLVVALGSTGALAGKADVTNAAMEKAKDGTYVVIATIRHADEDFDHFANRFEVLAPDGTILATRPLVHPHITEQPFTRALARVKIPQGITQVIIRAHDKRDGYGGAQITVQVPGR